MNVKDGWGPICKILGKEIPNEPFPRANDGKAAEEFFKTYIKQAIVRWTQIIAAVVVAVVAVIWYWFK